MQQDTQTTTLRPSWKQFFIPYLLSVLTIPLFGIGLIAFYYTWRKHHEVVYKVTNTQISSEDGNIHRTIDLVNIEKVELKRSWLQEKLDIGTVVLFTSASEMFLIGMTTPAKLQQILDTAIENEKARQQQKPQAKPREPAYEPGSMDKMDYLTGLWQQGLISNEDYDKERKHFED